MSLRTAGTLLLASLVLSSGSGRAADKGRLSLDLYLDLETVQEPRLSPDAKQIVFTRRYIDKLNDKWESALWIMNADGAKQRFLVKGSAPRWSPDGTRLAYLAEGEPRGSQVFVRYMDAEGTSTQITRVDKAPANVSWSPDGKQLAFLMLVPKADTWSIKMPAAPRGAKWTEPPRIVERLNYRRDRVGFLEDGYRHVFLVPATGGTPRQITNGDYDHGGFSETPLDWTPDGREILVSGLRSEDAEYQWRESEIYAVNVADKSVRQLTHRKGPDGNPEVSPDGKWVAYTGFDATDDTYTTSKLYVMGIDGSNPRRLAADLDRSPESLFWAPDRTGVYFTADDHGSRNVYFAPVAGGPAKAITQGVQVLTLGDLRANGLAVGTASSPKKPVDIVAFSLARPELRQLTNVNDDILQDVTLGEVEEINYTSLDDMKIQGWIVKPPDFDPHKKYPLMLSIHGGPHAMDSVAFNYAFQEHAAQGYLVLYTNPRGSTGYGSAFGNAINNAYPSKDYDDLMKGVDVAIAKGYVDEKNLFVYGCSGGGVLTAWTVGHTDRFAAASSNCPVINWVSFVGTTDGSSWYRNFKKAPWEDMTEHWDRSPLKYVGNVKTPTMLMTGVNDLRTPISQTEEFYEALKYRKVPTAMVRFNDEFHGTSSKPSNFIRTQLYLRRWFAKYSRGGSATTVTSQPNTP